MAISPVVNAYMQEQEAQPQSADNEFAHQFTNQAFNTLRTKYPALMGNIVTLKTLACDLNEATAFGVFIVESGDSLVYVPVVMSDGSIVSCEMAYDKDSDQLFPLNQHTVKEILNRTETSSPTLLTHNPRVEDTHQLFHNMIRPPQSSNVVLAGERAGVSGLPNACKAALSTYLLEQQPELLAKLAGFYDVELLAHKLAQKPEQVKTASDTYTLPSFLSLDTLTRQAAELLQPDERKTLLKQGYLVRSAENAPLGVAQMDKLASAVETELRLETYPDGHHKDGLRPYPVKSCFEGGRCPIYNVGIGDVVSYNMDGLQFTRALLTGIEIVAADSRRRRVDEEHKALVQDIQTTGLQLDGFSEVLIPASRLLAEISKLELMTWPSMYVLVPMRNGAYCCIDTRHWICAPKDKWQVSDNVITVYGGDDARIVISRDISLGYITHGPQTLVVPEGVRFVIYSNSQNNKPLPAVESLTELLGVLRSFGTQLTTTDNGAGISITDRQREKTASFANSAAAAGWLHTEYGMDAGQIATVLGNRHSLVFRKTAFLDPDYAQLQQQPPMGAQMDMPPAQTEMPVPNFAPLNDFAATEDPELFDVGMLSTFAEYPDIKSMLVEYLPDFMAAEDKVGRIILLFSSQKKEIEKVYGTEKTSTLMSSCRRIFTILGDLVASLKLYVHMV